jgi:hypothetical protein
VHIVLAPTLNLHRSPLGGRHFECLSEEPELAGRTGAALVLGIQAHGVAATAKHYVANDSETDRLTADVRVGERVLREVYLVPFEIAVERWLAGYAPVEAEPGEAVTAVVRVPARALRHWSKADRGWRVEPGAYRVLAGPSVGKLPLTATVEV